MHIRPNTLCGSLKTPSWATPSPGRSGSFPGQAIVRIERVHSAKRELDSPPRRRRTTPLSEVSAAKHDLHQNGVVCDLPPLYFDFRVRQRLHQLLVKQTNSVSAFLVFIPRLVIVPAESPKVRRTPLRS